MYFVGIRHPDANSGEGGKFPLGWPVPDGTDAAAKKRKASVESWTHLKNQWVGYSDPIAHRDPIYKDYEGSFKTIDNVPTEGFRFVGDIKRSRDWFGSGASVWRVEDPRGFEFEITSGNLMMLMELTTIEQGLIKGKCIYARDGAKNALLFEGSEEYQATLAQTNRMKDAKKFSLKSLQPGDEVKMVDGSTAFYYGKVNCLVEVKTSKSNHSYPRSIYTSQDRYTIRERYLLISACKTNDSSYTVDLPATPKIAGLIKPSAGPDLNTALKIAVAEHPYILLGGGENGYVVYLTKQKLTDDDLMITSQQVKGSELFEVVATENIYQQPCNILRIAEKYKSSASFYERGGKLYLSSDLYKGNIFGFGRNKHEDDFVLLCDTAPVVKSANGLTSRSYVQSVAFNGFFEATVSGTSVSYDKDNFKAIRKNGCVPTNWNWSYNKPEHLMTDAKVFFDEMVLDLDNMMFKKYSLTVHGKTIPAFTLATK
jgi:hypothetical protein